MFHVIFGNDVEAKEKTLQKFLKSQNAALSSLEKISDPEFFKNSIANIFESQSLFGDEPIYFFDHLLENGEVELLVEKHIADFAKSSKNFIFWEHSIVKDVQTLLKKKSLSWNDHSIKIQKAQSGFSVFSLADALGKRDKKEAWVLFTQAIEYGASPEEIHGILFWQIKTLLLLTDAKPTPETTGINPFVFRKATGFSKNFSREELKKFSQQFVTMYHEARMGKSDMSISLEQFLLSI